MSAAGRRAGTRAGGLASGRHWRSRASEGTWRRWGRRRTRPRKRRRRQRLEPEEGRRRPRQRRRVPPPRPARRTLRLSRQGAGRKEPRLPGGRSGGRCACAELPVRRECPKVIPEIVWRYPGRVYHSRGVIVARGLWGPGNGSVFLSGGDFQLFPGHCFCVHNTGNSQIIVISSICIGGPHVWASAIWKQYSII